MFIILREVTQSIREVDFNPIICFAIDVNNIDLLKKNFSVVQKGFFSWDMIFLYIYLNSKRVR